MGRVIRNVLFAGLVLIIAVFLTLILGIICQQNSAVAAGLLGALLLLGLLGVILWSRNLGRSIRDAIATPRQQNPSDPYSDPAVATTDRPAQNTLRAALTKLKYLKYALLAIMAIRLLLQIAKWFNAAS